jgi:phosphatidylglycerol lysyltransferase
MTAHHFRPRFRDLWIVRLIALMAAMMGIINVLAAITPAMANRLALLEQFSPLEVRRGGHLTAALAGFALIILASSLWRRKRVAWLITVVVLLISSISHMLKGLDFEEAALAGVLALCLIIFRSYFHARSDRPSIFQGLTAVAISLTFILAYGALGFFLLDKHYSVHFGFWAAIRQTVVMFTQFYDPGLTPLTGFGRYFADSIYLVGAVAMGYALLMLVRPVFLRAPATIAERARAKAIVEANGCSPLARLTLLDDKSYFFSPGGSVIAFASRGHIALALGDPIGPADDAEECISAFKAICIGNDWEAVFYQVRTDYLDFYLAAGFKSLYIGQEAVIDLATFTIAGGEKKSIRTSVNRLTKLNYRTEVIPPPLSNDLVAALRDVSDEWLTNMNSAEMRFSVGWFEDDYIRNGPVMVVRDPEGEINAFVNIVPEYQLKEVTIDLMRHRRDSENGLMDFLFVSLFLWAKEAGYETFNLGLSALAGIGEQKDERVLEWALNYIYEHQKRFYNFKGVHAFKAKYQPIWEPRYLIYSNAVLFPEIALALAQAEMGKENYFRGIFSNSSTNSRITS